MVGTLRGRNISLNKYQNAWSFFLRHTSKLNYIIDQSRNTSQLKYCAELPPTFGANHCPFYNNRYVTLCGIKHRDSRDQFDFVCVGGGGLKHACRSNNVVWPQLQTTDSPTETARKRRHMPVRFVTIDLICNT